MKINAQYVLQEPPYGDATQPDSQDFILEVAGDRLLGEAYLPSGLYDAPHPAVIVCHGIPGTNNNDDLCQSLRRMAASSSGSITVEPGACRHLLVFSLSRRYGSGPFLSCHRRHGPLCH